MKLHDLPKSTQNKLEALCRLASSGIYQDIIASELLATAHELGLVRTVDGMVYTGRSLEEGSVHHRSGPPERALHSPRSQADEIREKGSALNSAEGLSSTKEIGMPLAFDSVSQELSILEKQTSDLVLRLKPLLRGGAEHYEACLKDELSKTGVSGKPYSDLATAIHMISISAGRQTARIRVLLQNLDI
jgi:hypothetical protein